MGVSQSCVSKHVRDLLGFYSRQRHRGAMLTPGGEAHHIPELSQVVERSQTWLLGQGLQAAMATSCRTITP